MGLPIFRADQGHIHHRLSRLGFSRRRTVLQLYGLSLVFLVCAFGVFWLQGRFLPIWIGVAALAIILPAHRWGFIPSPRQLGQLMRGTSELRRESSYALPLGRWFELEAERARSIEELWITYQFVVGKLGFARVTVLLEDQEQVGARDLEPEGDDFQCPRHERMGGEEITVALEASTEMSRATFEHLSELGAEMWLKAATRWRAAHGLPIRWGPREGVMCGPRSIKRTKCLIQGTHQLFANPQPNVPGPAGPRGQLWGSDHSLGLV